MSLVFGETVDVHLSVTEHVWGEGREDRTLFSHT